MKYICRLNIYKAFCGVAKRLSCIQDARCLKVKERSLQSQLAVFIMYMGDVLVIRHCLQLMHTVCAAMQDKVFPLEVVL